MRFFGLILGLLIGFQGVGQGITLDQAIAMAIQHDEAIQIAEANYRLAQANNTKGNAGSLPLVNFVLANNLTNNNIKQKFSNGTDVVKNYVWGDNLNAAIQASYRLYDGGQSKAVKQRLEALALQAKSQMAVADNAVRLQVINVFYQCLFAQNNLRDAQELATLIESRMTLAKDKFDLGAISKVEYLQAQIDFNTQKGRIVTLQQAIAASKAALNNLIGQAPQTSLTLVASEPAKEIFLLEEEIKKALAKNNQLLQLQQQLAVHDALIKESEAANKPKVNLTGSYGYNFSKSQAGFSLYNQNLGLNVGLNLTYPIYQGGEAKRVRQIANLNKEITNKYIAQYANSISQQVVIAYDALQFAEQSQQLQKETVALAQEQLTIIMERMRLGQSNSYLEVKQAQNNVDLAQNAYQEAVLQYHLALQNLKNLQGE